jgi:hypothetical protein
VESFTNARAEACKATNPVIQGSNIPRIKSGIKLNTEHLKTGQALQEIEHGVIYGEDVEVISKPAFTLTSTSVTISRQKL